MYSVTIYTDGSCSGNPGPGGWAAKLSCNGRTKIVQGSEPFTTNNRMELTAVIMGLKALKKPCDVVIYTDSEYVANPHNKGWLEKWVAANWQRKGEVIPNADLWLELLTEEGRHQSVMFVKVQGHNGNPDNEEVDKIAVNACITQK